MKKLLKKLTCVALLFAMVVTLLPTNLQAATAKKSITLYKGEGIYYTDYGTVKSVKSSNSKVVKAAKDKQHDYRANMVAKKAGKATVSVSTKYGSAKIAVTVKNAKFTPKLVRTHGGYILVSVKNDNKDIFDKAEIKYTIKDSNGEVIAENTDTVSNLLAGKVAYTNIYVGSDNIENVDLSQSTVKVTKYERTWLGYTYKDVSSKVKCTAKITEEKENSISFDIVEKNTVNQMVDGCVYAMIYDANDKLIGVEKYSLYLDKKETKTVNHGYISKYDYPDYDHMKLVVQAYYTTRDKNF